MSTRTRLIGVVAWLSLMAALIVWFMPRAHAQGPNPVTTQPYGVYSTNASGIVTVTNTFQVVFNATTGSQKRAGCTIVNYGTHTMWVFFGKSTDTPATTSSVQLAANQSVTCNVSGITLQDQVWITGTATDAFFAAQQ